MVIFNGNSPIFRPTKIHHTAFRRASYERSTTSDLWARHKDLPPAEGLFIGTSGNFTGEKLEKWMDLRKKTGHLGILDDFRCHSQIDLAFPRGKTFFHELWDGGTPKLSGIGFLGVSQYLQQQSHDITLLGSYPCTKQFLAMYAYFHVHVGFSYFSASHFLHLYGYI